MSPRRPIVDPVCPGPLMQAVGKAEDALHRGGRLQAALADSRRLRAECAVLRERAAQAVKGWESK